MCRSIGNGKWVVRLAIQKEPTEKDPAPFRWLTFKERFDSETEARDYLKNNNDAILAKFDLYLFDD